MTRPPFVPPTSLVHGVLLCLGACLSTGCGMFNGGNWMKSRADVPFDLGKVESALWIESVSEESYDDEDSIYGRAQLLLIDDSMDCDDLADGDFIDEDGAVWDSSGIVASLRYSAYGEGDVDDWGFEGDYWMGVDHHAYIDEVSGSRYWYGAVFGEGIYVESYYAKGSAKVLSHDSDVVKGKLETPMFKAGFTAENCGEEGDYDDDDDDDDGGDTG